MTKVRLTESTNSDGSVTRTIRCNLEEVIDFSDATDTIIDNPIRTLEWNKFWKRYVIVPDDETETEPNNSNNNNNNETANDNDNGNDNDNDNDNDSFDLDGTEFMGTRRLSSVYWWPPSGPDGGRWEHLRNRNQPPANDADGNPIDRNSLDTGRLRLRTKIFSPSGTTTATTTTTTTTTATTTEETKQEDDHDDDHDDDRGGEEEEKEPERDEAVVATTTSENYDNDDIADNTCSICLCELEEGDVIGDIRCGHAFHKDCLKEWLVKNNHCPICRMEGIASHPARDRDEWARGGRRRRRTRTQGRQQQQQGGRRRRQQRQQEQPTPSTARLMARLEDDTTPQW